MATLTNFFRSLVALKPIETVFKPSQTTPASTKPTWFKRLWKLNAPLTLLGVVMGATCVASVVGIVVDQRIITGVPAWVKPTKFALSVSIYSFTLVWLLGFVKGRPRLVALVGTVTAITLFIEMVILIVQVVRGTTSHFNVSTPLDSTLFQIMGNVIVFVWLMNFLAAILVLRQSFSDPAFAWSLRLGLFLSMVGMGVASLMFTNPVAAQDLARAAGHSTGIIGAHSVGVADGGPGLPFLGWSTVGGDLRIPHFFGLHSLQLMPLLGWLISRPAFQKLGTTRRVVLVWTAGGGYLGWILLLTWQALRSQPFLAPDGLTLLALGGLITLVGAISGVTVVSSRRKTLAYQI